jgi:hypothetical protein
MEKTINSIPKILHYVWFGPKKPEYLLKNIESWKKFCPDWEIKEWNEETFDLNCNQFAKEAFEDKKWAFVSDYIRLHVLKEYGGVYLDTDVELFANIDHLLEKDFFTNFENDNMVCLAATGARKQSPIISEFIKLYENRSFFKDKKRKKPDMTPNVISCSVFFKDRCNVLLNGTTQEKIIFGESALFLDKRYFFAQDYVTKKITRTEKCLGIHIYVSSWQGKKEKRDDRLVEFIHAILPERFFRFCMRQFLKLRVIKYRRIFRKLKPELFLVKNDKNKSAKQVAERVSVEG